ncbi:hypothetical protein P3T76_008722 [Phytophthora citrophthora]|uniref:Thioredoxin domain-containing protein n=1 Tax=Phytophthora citrophthora TaxID=4793 RepID=A0AAD9LJS5_9STRA|nr:hypothetical protein P3T76_008722 [Phytophthora citrophthora]
MARGQAGGAQSSAHADMKVFLRNRMWRDHWYVLLSVGVIVVALFGSAFLQFSTSKDHVYRIEVTDSALMERVFRSGEPWVVLCSGPDDVLPDVFDKVSPRLAGKSSVGVLDCKQKLPGSGKSVLNRYGIKKGITPTVFTVANGEKPKQVFLNHLQSAAALAKHVKTRTKKTMHQVQNSAQLEARCLSRSSCVLILRGQRFQPHEKQWIDKLMLKYRTLSFAWIDSTSLKLSLEKMLPDARQGEHRLVLFRRQRDTDANKKILAAKAFRDDMFNAVSVGTFLDENAHSELKPLGKSPKVLHRGKSKSSQPDKSGNRDQRRTRRRPRRKEREAEEEEGYYFPQHVNPDEDNERSHVLDDVEEEEDVLDLDDDEDDE